MKRILIARLFALAIAILLFWAAPAHPSSLEGYIYSKCLDTYGTKKSREKARYYTPLITRQAKKHGIDPFLVASLVWHESNFNPREVSPAGALGLCQVMPLWFRHYRVPLSAWRDPEANLGVALRIYSGYRGRMARTFRGIDRLELDHRTLVAYNRGPKAVSRGVTRSRYSRLILKDARRPHAR